MQEQTTRLGLPYILPSQAQKHVPHNEALDALDAMVQLVLAGIANDPPPAPAEGACYGVDAAPTGAWSTMAGSVAQWRDGGWRFVRPQEGWLAWCVTEQRLHVHDGAHWQRFAHIGALPALGINATADDANRLAVAAPASLFTHTGSDHRLKINKAGAGDTATLLFQSDWVGQAEMGLAGSNAFAIKVADAGGAWHTALSIGATGHVATPLRPAARAWRQGIMVPPASSLTGFTSTEFSTGGLVLGTAVPGGSGNRLVAPVTAHYLVVLSVLPTTTAAFQVDVVINGTRTAFGTAQQSGAPAGRKVCVSGVVPIAQNDWIALRHEGSASLDFGFDKTELFVVALT
ncbi:DUF2793 domain-containing protein [Mycoplana dimorpha]|uniref:Uncharacterized protein DUF2793 n=1 Tax=Mycoplana dimorpha TaxID=28320 RepID=A0A2T5B1I3_MYCDI|nr:DUF2793 domain-containing protein [Mycoplana dimorpha]PTM92832.1 uncharacterized protein DUF2793 [Mycoplana dimorpha]